MATYHIDLGGLDNFYTRVSSVYFGGDEVPIVFDTVASVSISPFAEDFVNLKTNTNGHTVTGLSHPSNVQGTGTVRWSVMSDDGKAQTIETQAYYVPDARVRLFSVTPYLKEQKSGHFAINSKRGSFQFPRTKSRVTFSFNIPRWNNLPVAFPYQREQHENRDIYLNVVDDDDTNLSAGDKELLSWHFRLGHFNMSWIYKLTRPRKDKSPPLIPLRSKVDPNSFPLCSACQLGKAHLQHDEATKTTIREEKDGAIKAKLKLLFAS